MALVVLSKVEQGLDAVRAVLGGAQVTEVAGSLAVSRQTLHEWLTRYLVDGVAGLADRSHRPHSCRHATPETVRVRLVEMRRQRRILAERHVIASLGGRGLVDLLAEEVDAWLAEKARTLSTDTVHRLGC